jgi:periplasmic copper chaperone A
MKTRLILATAVATLASTTAVFAHATFANQPAKVGSYVAATLQVPHGCDGKATNEVQIKLPEGFISAKPMPKAGWDVEVITGDYQNSYDNHGKAVKSGPVEIRFKNGDLPDNFYDTFVVYGKIAAGDPQTGLAFPTVQLCGADAKVAWDQIAAPGQDPHDLDGPAPILKLAAADANAHAGHGAHGAHAGHAAPAEQAAAGHGAHGAHGDHAGHGDHMAATNPGGFQAVTAGDLELAAGFTRAMLPGQPVGGGFITITNNGGEDDKLVSATSAQAGEVQLHEMSMEGDVMKMRQLSDGIAIPAGETVELKPGGLHLMFYKVAEPFKEGAAVNVTLNFEKAGAVDVVLPVGPARGN